MSKKWVIIALSVVAVIFLYTISQNSYTKNVKYFVAMCEKSNAKDAVDFYFSSFSDRDKDSLVKLVNNHSEKVPSIFIMVLADHIYKTNKDKAIQYYYTGRLRAKEDVFMCKDTTARQQVYVYPRFAQNTVSYASKRIFQSNDKEYLAKVLQKSLDWDKSHPKRFDPTWACYHGIGAFIEPNKKPELVDEKAQQEVILNERKNVEDTIKDLRDKNSPSLN